MQGFDAQAALASVPIPELDPLEVDGLLSFFNQPGPGLDLGPSNQLLSMQAQVPFRDTPAGLMEHPANLFSSIMIPEAPFYQYGRDQQTGGDSGGSTADESNKSGKSRNPETKVAAIQEKNRRAQKRFRERQKAKMQDMTVQLDDMTSELSKLRVENSTLRNRNSILEKVLALRDEHIRVLQDEQHVFDLGFHYLHHQTISAASQQKLVTGGPTQGGSALVTGSAVQRAALTDVNVVKTLPAEAVINHWKELVRELGNLLVEVEGCPSPADPKHQVAMDSLCRALDAAGEVCMLTGVLHPTNMQRLIAATLDDGRSGVRADDKSRWTAIARSLQLSEEQGRQLLALRHIFVHRMAKVTEQRREILAKLQAVAIPDRMVALQSVITETLKVNEATVALKANLQEEHLCGMEFIGTVFKTIFSPLQKARAIVQSYPFYPDVFEIANAVAADKGIDVAAVPLALGAPPVRLATELNAAGPMLQDMPMAFTNGLASH